MRLKDLDSQENKKSGLVRLSDLEPSRPTAAERQQKAKQDANIRTLNRAITEGIQQRADDGRITQESTPKQPSYGERVQEEINKFPAILRPIAAPIAALAEAPWNRAIGYYAAPEPIREEYAAKHNLPKPEGAAALVGQVVAPFAVGGAGLGTGTGIYRSTQQAVGGLLPRLGTTRGGRVVQEGLSEAITGAAVGAGTEFAQGSADPRQAAINAAIGAGAGGLLGAAGRGLGELVSTVRGRRAAVPVGAAPTPSGFAETPVQSPETAVQRAAPVYAVQTPATQRTASIQGQRSFIRTLEDSGKLTDDVAEVLRKSPERSYEVQRNVDTVSRANQNVAQGIDQAEAKLLGKSRYNADDVATGMRLIDELQRSGNTGRAVTIAENLARQLTEAGQAVQAASIWNRLTPEGALLAAQRRVNSINDNLLRGQKEVKISEQQAQSITDAASAIQASGVSRERAGDVMQIMERVRKGETISVEDRQTVADFVSDAKRFLKPSDTRQAVARSPKELSDTRVRDRVLSVLESQEQAAKERLRSKGVNISSNPIDVWADYAYVGALKLAKGAVKFADWSEQMVRELGDGVRPYLRQIWDKSQETLNQNVKRINDQVISRSERIAESYLKANEAKLQPQDVDFIRNLAQKVSSLSGAERQAASQDLQAIMSSFEKVGIGRRLSAVQYIAMLLNPLTQIRNIAGNELLYRLERLSRLVATPIDIVYSNLMGKERTITMKRGPSVWDNFFSPSQEFWKNLGVGAKAGWRGVSPEGLTSKYEIQGLAFDFKPNDGFLKKSAKAFPLYLEKALGAALQGFDYAAYQRAATGRIQEMAYIDALNNGIKGSDNIRSHMQTYMANLDEGVENIAKEYGKYVTLQDDSLLSRGLMKGRRWFNKITTGSPDFGAGSVAIPFAKTPANLLLRALDYTPAGILKAISQARQVLKSKKTDLTRADVITSVSRAIMGTGIGAVGWWLADKGALFGQTDSDSETRKLQQLTGIRDFQINGSAMLRMIEALGTGGDIDVAAKLRPGDVLWQYEWAQPTSMPMAVGANIAQGIKGDKGLGKTTMDAALAGANTLYNSSVLSGIREAFQIPTGEDNVVKAVAMNLAKQMPGMFTPSFLRQFNTLSDDAVRESYDPDWLTQTINPSRANIPGQAQQLPQRVDTLGRPQTRNNSVFDVFLNPAARSRYEPSAEAQLVLELLSETGDTRVAPRAVAKYLSGKDISTGLQRKVNLTPDQYVRLQTLVGQESAKRISKINPKLPTDRKVELVIKALDEAGKLGRNALKKELGLRP